MMAEKIKLRDEIAIHAMNGLIENCSTIHQENESFVVDCGKCAKMAYDIADAMMVERIKHG